MTRRTSPALLALLVIATLGVAARPAPVPAQDRGAPLFGPDTPTDSVTAEPSDAGRVWSLANPPVDRFRQRYGVTPDSAWARHVRRGILRLPNCTAALVSENGLALTTDACVRSVLEDTATDDAFVAGGTDSEHALPGLYADRLLDVRDVTSDVRAAQSEGRSPDEAVETTARRLENRADEPREVVVSETAPGEYEAAIYRRYEDVRLVFRPGRGASALGGIDSYLTYPRYTLDAALLRVYDADGRPLSPDHYFEAPTQEPSPGDAVFSVGHASSTRRAASAAQLEGWRDVELPAELERARHWVRALDAYVAAEPASRGEWADTLTAARQTAKQLRAHRDVLRSDYVTARLARRDEELRPSYGGILDSLAAIQDAQRANAGAYRAFGGLTGGGPASPTLRRALLAKRASGASGPAADRLWARLRSISDVPTPVETSLLAERLRALQAHFGPESATARRLMNGFPSDERAAALVEGSVFSAVDRLDGVVAEGMDRVPPDDPALAVVETVWEQYRAFAQEWQSLRNAEAELTDRLARARAEMRTRPLVAAVDGAPRLTDGRLLGYPYNGTEAPSFTTFFGMYGQSRSFEAKGSASLPARWWEGEGALDRSAPLMRAGTTDPVVATRGAPLLNRHLEIVGVVAGANVQGAGADVLFLPERMRTVAVDIEGLREALRSIYGADGLARELFGAPSSSGESGR